MDKDPLSADWLADHIELRIKQLKEPDADVEVIHGMATRAVLDEAGQEFYERYWQCRRRDDYAGSQAVLDEALSKIGRSRVDEGWRRLEGAVREWLESNYWTN